MTDRTLGPEQWEDLVNEIGIGRSGLMMPTAYDTAWLARIPAEHDPSLPAFPEALDWLRQNQRPDGSWGGEIEYAHDRVISTLTAMLALAEQGEDGKDERSIERGRRYIWKKADQLKHEHETIGFEMILPALLTRCREFGFDLPLLAFDRYEKMRNAKLAKIPQDMVYSRNTTLAFSLEWMGDEFSPEKAGFLQEVNGSVGVSPSATAYFLTKCNDNAAARRYIADVAMAYRGKAPQVFPFDVFETAWSLWNLALAGFSPRDPCLASTVTDLARLWERSEGMGLGFSSSYSAPDADDMAMVFSVLRWAGYEPDGQVFRKFERDGHFVCYPWERDDDHSVSVNVHILGALRGLDHDATAGIIDFLASCATPQGYWRDKWHISPYYTTAHAIITLIGVDQDDMARSAVQWILDTQRPDGCWGYYNRPTAEETAYCLQALSAYNRHVEPVDSQVLARGREGLLACKDEMPALWVGKCLYTPVRAVMSAIYAALVMTGL